MTKPANPYASTTAGRAAAAAEIERMAADLKQHDRALFAIYQADNTGGWRLEFSDIQGFIYAVDGDTLDAAYLAAMHWPGTPPPF